MDADDEGMPILAAVLPKALEAGADGLGGNSSRPLGHAAVHGILVELGLGNRGCR